jgi:hypothetical protein
MFANIVNYINYIDSFDIYHVHIFYDLDYYAQPNPNVSKDAICGGTTGQTCLGQYIWELLLSERLVRFVNCIQRSWLPEWVRLLFCHPGRCFQGRNVRH